MTDSFLMPAYRLPSVQAQGNLTRQQVDTPLLAFGATALERGAQRVEQGADALFQSGMRELAEANATRINDLNNQYIEAQTQILSTGKDAFYTKQGENAIKGADTAVKSLQALRDNILSQPMSDRARVALSARLNDHVNESSAAIGRHVGNQSLVWRDNVAKGTVIAATNRATSNYNDPVKVAAMSEVAWRTEYERAKKQIGEGPDSDIAARASADGARSDLLSKTIALQAVTDPGMAQRTLDKYRGQIAASDSVALENTIKDATLKRKTQDIVTTVSATGGVSPNYNARVKGAEGGSRQTENSIGALGDYQMTRQTYTDLAQQTEWGKGKSQAEIRAMLVDQKEGPKRQDELQALYNDRSVQKLRAAGVKVNDLTLYATHFLGHGAGPKILSLPDDTPLKPGMVQAHGGDAGYVDKVYESNPFLAKVNTVGDLKAVLAQKIAAPLSMANTGTPEKPNLDAMLANGLVLAGNDPDLRERVTHAIKTDYATKHAIYAAQIGALEKQAFAHIDAGGTVENLPGSIRAGLDGNSLTNIFNYEEKRTEKRRKENAEAAGKALTDLEGLGQLTPEDVEKGKPYLTANEYRAWQKRARTGEDRMDDPGTYERIQRGIGTRDMRDDIYSEFSAGNLSKESLKGLLEKNTAFLDKSAPASPYKVEHDRVTRSLDPGLMGSGISREIAGRAVKELDQYVASNPQREGETPDQYRKRLSDFNEDNIKRHQLIKTGDMAVAMPVPAHAPLDRAKMTQLPKDQAQKELSKVAKDIVRKQDAGQISEDQADADILVLDKWRKFVDERPEPEAKGKK